MNRVMLLALLAAAGCGSLGVSDGGDDGDGDGFSCSMVFTVDPEPAAAGGIVKVIGVAESDVLAGLRSYEWSVRFDDQPVAFDVTSEEGDVIEFAASEAGVYSILLEGEISLVECFPDLRDVNVRAPDAESESLVLRVVPAAGDGLPAQDRDITVWGGADLTLGPVVLGSGLDLQGTSLDTSGAPAAAYLRATPAIAALGGPPLLYESFAGDDGLFSMRLPHQTYDLLVVPADPGVAPYFRGGLAADLIGASTTATAPDSIAVTVESGAGDPLAGARVSLVVDGLPSSVGVTDGSGAATVHISAERPGPAGTVSVSVVPPDESGLPELELPAAQGATLAAGDGAIAVRYAPSLSARTVDAVVVRLAGAVTPVPGARVTWIARPLAAAGTIEIDGSDHAAAGRVRRAAEAGGGGVLPALLLPEVVYDVVVEPPIELPGGADPDQEAVALAPVDLEPGSSTPATLRLAAPAELRGQVLDADDSPLAGARVHAVSRALLAGAAAAGASVRTGEDGGFTLLLAGGGEFEITIDGTPVGAGRARQIVTMPAAGNAEELGAIPLPATLRASGVVSGESGPLGGAYLQLFCRECGTDGGWSPVAQTVTDGAGRFVLVAPDPGVTTPE